jgi:hypothetical protein
MSPDFFECPHKIFLISHNEFHFVNRTKVGGICPEILRFHTAPRTLEIDYPANAWIHPTDIQAAARLQKGLIPTITKKPQQVVDPLLNERFSSGHLNEPARVTADRLEDLLH